MFSDPDGRTLDAYGVSIGLPATVVLDSRGQIVKTSHAVQTVALLRSELPSGSVLLRASSGGLRPPCGRD